MGWLSDYCDEAGKSDRLSSSPVHTAALAAGLMGEVGSILAELKKQVRETEAYPSYRRRLEEELGDFTWYWSRLASILAPDAVGAAEGGGHADQGGDLPAALEIGEHAGRLLHAVRQGDDCSSELLATWASASLIARSKGLSLKESAHSNLEKIRSRWPERREPIPWFDEQYEEHEQLPRNLTVEFRERHYGDSKVVVLRCNGLNFGDRLTDNIVDEDYYRFHDIFHFSHAVHLGWSPVIRALLRCKRKSNRGVDANQDGARAVILEEAVTAIVFSRAKELRFFDGLERVDYDLLKTIQEFVRGYEVEVVPLWQWEDAIIDGYRVFRELRRHRGGTVELSLGERRLEFRPPPKPDRSS